MIAINRLFLPYIVGDQFRDKMSAVLAKYQKVIVAYSCYSIIIREEY
jgi:hypothetical protein